MCADLVELLMHDFDVILGMETLHCSYVCIYFHVRVVGICFPNEEELVFEGYNLSHPNPLISNLMDSKQMSKGLLCNLISVK